MKVKILFFCFPRHPFNQRSEDYFKIALVKNPNVDVRFVHEGGDVREIITRLDFSPDFIYIHDLEQFLLKRGNITGLSEVKIPKGLLFNDLHRNGHILQEFVEQNHINLIFAHYRDAFSRFFPNYKDQFRWLPYAVNLSIFKNYHKRKTINYLLMGATNPRFYPLRHKIYKCMKNKEGFIYHAHPGYRDFSKKQEDKLFVENRYAKEINRAKIFFTDDLIYHYPVKKFFEVVACNTLLLASGSQELKDLGFVDGETYVEINQENFEKKAKYYLKHKEERKQIANNGYKMVRARHSIDRRSQEFVDMITEYLGGLK
ncbi:glycosyltransferase [Paenibacillus aestuarii]|uniref:Glycosyltransferase n=1 Tax=Paenibacillus aestuarii TaxID=516965 RepID=A0ABW0KEU5_9BACL|nr:glycosyltransferase [Paenibacillus aestuarii]